MERFYNRSRMPQRTKLALAFFAVYLFDISTPFLANYGLTLVTRSIGGSEEFSRKTSPDGVLDAVVMQDNPGASSSFIYYLYLVPKGTKVETSSGDPPIVNTSEGDALLVNWEQPHFLTVTTGDSHVKFFGNLWYSEKVSDYYVELTLLETGRHYLQENGKLRGEH
jgi:hypothetical protein